MKQTLAKATRPGVDAKTAYYNRHRPNADLDCSFPPLTSPLEAAERKSASVVGRKFDSRSYIRLGRPALEVGTSRFEVSQHPVMSSGSSRVSSSATEAF